MPRWLLGGRGVVRSWLGLIPIAAGAALYLRCVWGFIAEGRGTPAPIDAPKELVVRGPYRVVRNPMYWAVLAVLAGEAVLFASWGLARYTLVVWTAFHLFVLLYEEPALRARFGASYEAYLARVPRWFPSLRR